MPFILEAFLTGFRTETPSYGVLSERILPQSEPVMVGFRTEAPSYATISSKILPQEMLQPTGFRTEAPAFAVLMDASPPDATSYPDPISTPYVEESDLDPAPDTLDVNIRSNIVIPCGDRVPEEDEVSFNAFTGNASEIPTRGLSDTKTIIEISYDGINYDTIYENGAGVGGWSVAKVRNDYSGYEKDVVVGYTYTLTPPPSGLLVNAHPRIRIELEDFGQNYTTYEYGFYTENASNVTSKGFFLVGYDMVQLTFTGELAVDQALQSVNTYIVSSSNGGQPVVVEQVLYPPGFTTDTVFLILKGLQVGFKYLVEIEADVLRDRAGRLVSAMGFPWEQKRTKFDATAFGLAKMFSTGERSVLRGLIEAIMISDEKIGGDY